MSKLTSPLNGTEEILLGNTLARYIELLQTLDRRISSIDAEIESHGWAVASKAYPSDYDRMVNEELEKKKSELNKDREHIVLSSSADGLCPAVLKETSLIWSGSVPKEAVPDLVSMYKRLERLEE